MSRIKKTVLFALIAATTLSGTKVSSQEYCTDLGGCGYEESRRACCITPTVLLAGALLTLIVAVAFHNNKGSGHGHGHSHGSCK